MNEMLEEMLDELEAEMDNPGTYDDIEAVWNNIQALTMDYASRQRFDRLEKRWDTMYKRSVVANLVKIVNS